MAEAPTTRPNRWTGPPSTWRSYTKEERNVASSLDAIRSQNLSIHLYNAHAIKSRVRASCKAKGKSTGEEESEFIPPDIWTAWPMPADEVPRDPYLPRMGGKGSWSVHEDMRPSAGLEEVLLAMTTRIGREKWRARRWEWSGGKAKNGIKEEMLEDLVSKQEGIAENKDLSPDRPMFSSQAVDALGNISSSSDEDGKTASENEAEVERRPVSLADDDRARRILLPTIRHIISKADDLLEGLQKAREAYAGNWNKTKAEDTTTAEDTDTGAGTSRSQARSDSRLPRKRARTSSVDSEASTISTRSASSRGRRKPKMKQLKLRDWSDVLGMAALTGWDANVVQRAAERCSGLFGEDMLFRTFEDGGKEEKSYFAEHFASGNKPPDSENEEGIEEKEQKHPRLTGNRDQALSSSPPVNDSALRCPVTTCPRHGKVYARSKNMYDHVRRAHPEVDIKQLKKLNSKRRGDKRGRWDRGSRQRSSSAVNILSP